MSAAVENEDPTALGLDSADDYEEYVPVKQRRLQQQQRLSSRSQDEPKKRARFDTDGGESRSRETLFAVAKRIRAAEGSGGLVGVFLRNLLASQGKCLNKIDESKRNRTCWNR